MRQDFHEWREHIPQQRMMMFKKIAIRHIAEADQSAHAQMLKCIHIGVAVITKKVTEHNQVKKQNKAQIFIFEKLGHIIPFVRMVLYKIKYCVAGNLFIFCQSVG